MRKKSIRENDWWTGDMLILITESRVRFSHWTSSFLFVMFKFDDDRTWSIDRWCSSLGEQGGKWCCWWTWWIFWVDPDFFQVIRGLFSLKLPLNESEPVVESRYFMITWNEYVAFLCAAWRCLEMWVNQVRIFILKNGASFPRCCCIVLVHDADSHGCFALVGWLMLSETVNEGNRRFCQRKRVCSVCRPSPWISHRLVRVVFRAASLSCRHLSESSHPVKYILL